MWAEPVEPNTVLLIDDIPDENMHWLSLRNASDLPVYDAEVTYWHHDVWVGSEWIGTLPPTGEPIRRDVAEDVVEAWLNEGLKEFGNRRPNPVRPRRSG